MRYLAVIILIIILLALHLQRPDETLHFYQNLISILCFILGKKAKITLKLFWFIKPPLIEISSFEEFKKKSYLPVTFDTFSNLCPTLDTGDLVIFIGSNYNINYVGSKWSFASPVTHLGLIIKEKDGSLKSLEATAKEGVIIKDLRTSIENYSSEIIAVRRLKDYKRTEEFNAIILRFIDDHYAKPHDLQSFAGHMEMIRSAVDLHIPFTNIEIFKNKEEKIDKFFCSELIALLFSQLGLLNLRTDKEVLTSNEFTPPDFSNYGNYTLRKKEVERKQLFDKFESEIFILKKDRKTLAD